MTTTTISEEQYDHAVELVQRHNLSDRVTVLKKDYRDLTGQYDKLVSIEMIEAVGHHYLDTLRKYLSSRLKPEGLALFKRSRLSSSAICWQSRASTLLSAIFSPAGLSSVGSIMRSIGRASDLRLLHFEDFASHSRENTRRVEEAVQ